MARADIVIPAPNEERALPGCIFGLRECFGVSLSGHAWRVVVAENGCDVRGCGRTLCKAWSESDANVLCCVDVDLSTGRGLLPVMVNGVVNDGRMWRLGAD